MKVIDLLKKFNINFVPSKEVGNIEINSEYDSYKIIQRTLQYINEDKHFDYNVFDCYHFENDSFYLEIVPDCNLEHLLMFKKLNGRWVGGSYDILGNVSSIS